MSSRSSVILRGASIEHRAVYELWNVGQFGRPLTRGAAERFILRAEPAKYKAINGLLIKAILQPGGFRNGFNSPKMSDGDAPAMYFLVICEMPMLRKGTTAAAK